MLACPHGGVRLRLLATIAAPAVIAAILAQLGLPIHPPDPTPARAPAWLAGPGAGCDDTAGPSAD